MCGREFFKFLKISMLNFEKKCGREFFELLKVSMSKFEVCAKEVFKLLKASSFKCVEESFLPLLQVSNGISSLCKKIFQMFVGFFVKVLFCDT
jgi:hypothetical protein